MLSRTKQPVAHHAGREHHRDVQGGGARAAVFGISDGLLTNVSLILGVAGAGPSASIVRLAGLAGLVAGAFSMAAGEYVSMSAQKELLERELDIERRELERHPEAETRSSPRPFARRGLDTLTRTGWRRPSCATRRSRSMFTLARSSASIRGQTGTPWQAAISSFVSFGMGAVIPLVPWFFMSGAGAVIASSSWEQ